MRVTALVSLLAVLAGCSESSDWSGAIETLPGGGTHVRNQGDGVWAAGSGWTLVEELRIGRPDADGADLFARVAGVEVDGAGRIWVLEGQSREVRVFAGDGAYVRTFGREGAGPGELRRPAGLAFDAHGDLWVPDPGNGRYARWDSAGRARGTVPMRTPPMRTGFVGGITPDGRLFDVALAPSEPGAPAVSPLMAAAGLGGAPEILHVMLRIDGTEPGPDAIPLPARDAPPDVFRSGGMTMAVPFSPRMHWLFDPGGAIWFGESDGYQIVRRTFDGDTVRIIERTYDARPVTAEDIAAWLAEPAAARLAEAGAVDRSRIPSTKPVFEDLLVDDAGHLWVRLVTADETSVFDVFDPDGRYLGGVSTADRVALFPRPVFRDGAMYAVVMDSLDVPYVVRYAIRR